MNLIYYNVKINVFLKKKICNYDYIGYKIKLILGKNKNEIL